EIREFSRLCNAIEDGVNAGRDVTELLEKWNRRAARPFQPHEFTTYYGAVSTEDFVEEALLPRPTWLEDLTYEELRSVFQAVMAAELPPAQHSYFLGWLEENLPGSRMSDLIYWPNHWFKDEAMLHVELTADQVLAYALLKSGRTVPGT